MQKFENLYRNKIWLINSSLNRTISSVNSVERISITPERFFHLMGFDVKCFDPNINSKSFGDSRINLEQLFKLCQSEHVTNVTIETLLNDFYEENERVKNNPSQWNTLKGNALYTLLQLMVQNEGRLLEMLGNGDLNNIVDIPKLMMKCYSFERLGFIENSSGMVIFDKKD